VRVTPKGVPVALVEQHIAPPDVGVEPRWEAAYRDVSSRLTARYENRVDPVLVAVIVARHFDTYLDARITIYVPLLVERAANDELRRSVNALERVRRP
jgi:hypothetical protein